ncbi:MAG: polysaccharide biosynthesis C-terminal domain-containing protein, partial [Bacteroidia bacterium]
NTIIALSPSHKSFLGIIGFSAILNIILNFYFIPIYGINGAAFATLISFILFNLIKYFYIKINFKLSPFNLNYLYIFVVSSSLFGLFYILPRTNYASVNILIRSVGFLLFYFPSLYFLKFSKEYNDLIDGALQKLKFKKS